MFSSYNSLIYEIIFFHLGAVEVSLTGKLSLEFNMIDIWRKPFGFKYLAFGNLHLAIGISVGVPLPSFGQYMHTFRTLNLIVNYKAFWELFDRLNHYISNL